MDRGQENGGAWERGGGEWRQRTEEDKQQETAGTGHSGDRGGREKWIGGTGGNG